MLPAPTPRSERAELRRNQVLDAAKRRFREFGFHSTSMAEIAHEADMSVGHIYRYFPSKESLIEGIVRQDIDLQLEELRGTLGDAPDNILAALVARWTTSLDLAVDGDRTALMIEIMAETARNPKIRALVEAAKDEIGATVRERLMAYRPGWSAEEAGARAVLIDSMIVGLALRLAYEPDAMSAELRALAVQTTRRLIEADA
jgi:AcrR family transcriptional regulator